MSFLFLVVALSSHAEEAIENSDIKVALVDENGRETSVYQMPPNAESVKDILFRTHVPSSISYSLWTLEITNPKTGQSYQLALESRVPSVIHWDGNFTVGGTLRPGQTYYFRILLFASKKTAYSSKVGVFTTQQSAGSEFVRVEREKLGFYAFPTGGLYNAWLKTKGPKAHTFPPCTLPYDSAFGGQHSFGFIIETSPNILTNVAVSPNGFFYSHVSVFYLTRPLGRAPTLH